MARVIGDYENGNNSAPAPEAHHLTAENGAPLHLPETFDAASADFIKSGQDLILKTPDGASVHIENYFSEPSALVGANGDSFSPSLVNSFVQGEHPGEFAQLGAVNDAALPGIGAVDELSGTAFVTHPDGTREQIQEGTPIQQGDIVETGADGSVRIAFSDESTFAISPNSRLAIDEYVFDPSSESGKTNVSVLKGMFMFTSGLIGREDPDDVKIETPKGSIGIRGTTIAGNVDTGQITVLEGAIVLRTPEGFEMTLSNQYETAKFGGSGGQIQSLGIMSAQDFTVQFDAIRQVAGDVFNGVGPNAPAANAPGANGEAPAGETAPADNAPPEIKLNMNEQKAAPAAEIAVAAEAKAATSSAASSSSSQTAKDVISSDQAKAAPAAEIAVAAKAKAATSSAASSSSSQTAKDVISSDQAKAVTNATTNAAHINRTTIRVSEGDDVVSSTAHGQTISTLGGNDYITLGHNLLNVLAGTGNDYIGGKTNGSALYGGDGIDTVDIAGAGNNVYGGNGDDTLTVNGDGNGIYGEQGDDTITVTGNNNQIFAEEGDDTVTIVSGTGNKVDLGTGDDHIIVTSTDSTVVIEGGAGTDTLVLDAGENAVWYLDGLGNGTQNISFTGIEMITTGASADNIYLDLSQIDWSATTDNTLSIELGTGDHIHFGDTTGFTLSYNPTDGYTLLYDSANDHSIRLYKDSPARYQVSTNEPNFSVDVDLYKIEFGSENNTVVNNGDYNILNTNGGSDAINNHGSHNTLSGGAGDDRIYLSGGEDNVVYGGAGNDNIYIASADSFASIHGGAPGVTDSSSTDVLRLLNPSSGFANIDLSGVANLQIGGMEQIVLENHQKLTLNLSDLLDILAGSDTGDLLVNDTDGAADGTAQFRILDNDGNLLKSASEIKSAIESAGYHVVDLSTGSTTYDFDIQAAGGGASMSLNIDTQLIQAASAAA